MPQSSLGDKVVGWTCAALLIVGLAFNAYEFGKDEGRKEAMQRMPEGAVKCRLHNDGSRTCHTAVVPDYGKVENARIANYRRRAV
jgi:hypothetical protein